VRRHRLRALLAAGAIGLACLALALVACGGSYRRADVTDTRRDVVASRYLRIATFNVRRFFDTVCDSGACGPNDYEDALTQGELDARADQLGAAILGLDADIVLLQEVESQASLDALMLRVADRLPHGVLGETGWPASLDVAILGPGTPTAVVRHADGPIGRVDGEDVFFARELLEVRYEVAGLEVDVFVAHFKSKVGDEPERRLAEAVRTREVVLAAAAARPDALIVLGGDFNDVPGSAPLEALEADGGLERLSGRASPNDVWTVTYQGKHLALDHLYLPPGRDALYVDGTVAAVRGRFGGGYGGSDHAALRAVFDLP